MTHELLGKHVSSSLWYTIMSRVKYTLENNHYDLDPGVDGLKLDWNEQAQLFNGCIYVNPPIPARNWARKTIQIFESNNNLNILYACYRCFMASSRTQI